MTLLFLGIVLHFSFRREFFQDLSPIYQIIVIDASSPSHTPHPGVQVALLAFFGLRPFLPFIVWLFPPWLFWLVLLFPNHSPPLNASFLVVLFLLSIFWRR